jgi:hypothetical protein
MEDTGDYNLISRNTILDDVGALAECDDNFSRAPRRCVPATLGQLSQGSDATFDGLASAYRRAWTFFHKEVD